MPPGQSFWGIAALGTNSPSTVRLAIWRATLRLAIWHALARSRGLRLLSVCLNHLAAP